MKTLSCRVLIGIILSANKTERQKSALPFITNHLPDWNGWLKWAPSRDVLRNTINWRNYCKFYLKNDFRNGTNQKLKTMRKLIFAINTSLDGYCGHTNFF